MRVRFEPLGQEIECGPEETLLDAAFRHGLNLAYGCREGQCSACKCFLLEGEVALKRHSSFALSDREREAGYTLMCRGLPEQDLVVELLHLDPEHIALEHAIREYVGVVESVAPLTHDVTRLVMRADGFAFSPGQYVDVHVPGAADGAKRSFSLANLPGGGRLELIIKRYPGGRLSGLLDGRIKPGDALRITGPYGSLHLRAGERPILMIAGGSGLAPILSLLRALAAEGDGRPVRLFFGARELFALDAIEALDLRDFRFMPVTERFVHEALQEYLNAEELVAPDVYVCGPTGMIDAVASVLVDQGVDEQHVYTDRFTTSADAPQPEPAGLSTERDFSWFEPRRRRATLYEDVTIDTQPSVHRHLTRGWPVSFADGRGTWDDASTALGARDWFAFRDPGEHWERPFYQAGATLERQLENAMRSAGEFAPGWVELLRAQLQVCAFVEHGLWFALATIGRACLSDTIATCVCLQAAMKQRSAQAIVLLAMDLEHEFGAFPIDAAREVFLREPCWQPTRRYLERLAAREDWGEVIVAANLCFEPVVGELLRREFGLRRAAAGGDTVTPLLVGAAVQEWEWARAWTVELVRFLRTDENHGAANGQLIDAWTSDWQPRALEAASALAPDVDVEALVRPSVRARRRLPTQRTDRAPAPPGAPAQDEADRVGIVMAKSAEGDAVATILARKPGIQVIEQPSFWEIRSKVRLAIPYLEISEHLGYEIGAYSLQREMSTHYGRMVATDEALLLFADPSEAMGYLVA